MLNMSIILFRYKQFASKIDNAISTYYFLCKHITDLQNSIHFITGQLLHKLTSTAARLKKSTAQWSRWANSARIFINLSWYELKSYAQEFGSVSVRFGSAKKSEVRFGSGSAKKSEVRFGFGKKFLVRSFPSYHLASRNGSRKIKTQNNTFYNLPNWYNPIARYKMYFVQSTL